MPASSTRRACSSWSGTASASSGTCPDYLVSTVAHLEELGIQDGPLHVLAKQLARA